VTVRTTGEPSLQPSDYVFVEAIRVRFAETDAMGIVHHSAYLAYLEQARVSYLRSVGHPYSVMRMEGIDHAVLECFVQYRAPLRFEEEVRVHLRPVPVGRASFQLNYLLTVDDQVRATAMTVHGCVDQHGRPVRIPPWLRTLLDG
jgi:acyl-CoA thioester hydrolase